MASPTLSWNLVRVFGTWRNLDGSLKAGTYKVVIPARVTSSTDDDIVPAGTFLQDDLQTAVDASPSLDVLVPATDDPDIEQTGWNVQITVTFTDGSATENYAITVPYANRPVVDGGNGAGVDLRTVAISSSLPQSDALYKVGVAGGLAQLNDAGQVVDSDGNPVTGGGTGTVASTDITDATVVGKNVLTAADAPAARTAIGAGTSSFDGAYASLTGKPTIPATAADVGAVPTARTVAGHALSVDVTLVKGDVGLGSVDNTADAAKAVLSATKLATSRTIDGQAFDGTANVAVVAPATHAATSKATPVDADELVLADSAASFGLKKLTWANLKAAVASYVASLAQALTNKDLTSGTNTFPTFNQSTTGNAATATKLATARAINGVNFDGTAAITVVDSTKVPTTRTVNGHALSADVALTNTDVGAMGFCIEAGGTYPARPASTAPVVFIGVDQPTGGGTTAGGAGSVNGLDLWFHTSS